MFQSRQFLSKLLCFLWIIGGIYGANAHAGEVLLADQGRALLKVKVADQASAVSVQVAEQLQLALQRITGADFVKGVASDPETSEIKAIFVGLADEWPGKIPAITGERTASQSRDDYLLLTENGSLYLIGRAERGLENALWEFLHRIGYRQFFPGKEWEVWPQTERLGVELQVYATPDFLTRNLFMAGRADATRRDLYTLWRARNRMESGFKLETGHAYGAIIKRNSGFFRDNPQAVAGEEIVENTKLNPDYPGLIALLIEDSRKRLATGGDSVSMDPSDGGGWSQESSLGRASNQAVYIANQVAGGIQEYNPGAKVGIYAYHEHSEAPDIAVDPNVIVSVATHFIRGGKRVSELIADWKQSGVKEFGIREYMSVWSWEMDMPGRSLAADPYKVAQQIKDYHQLGARYWTSEASYGWGIHGVGYYVASRVLWDVELADQVTELLEDFYVRAFGKAAQPMKQFYERYLFAQGRPLVSEDLLGRMYRTLAQALEVNEGSDVETRILALLAYTRYVECMYQYLNAGEDAKQQAYENLVAWVMQIDGTGMVNTRGVTHAMRSRNSKLEPVALEQPVQNWEREDWNKLLRDGIARNGLNDFQAVSYDFRNLVPYSTKRRNSTKSSKTTKQAVVRGGSRLMEVRGDNRIYLYRNSQDKGFVFEVKGGGIYENRGPVHLKLYADQHVIPGEPVSELQVPADQDVHSVTMESSYQGIHWLEVSDGNNLSRVELLQGGGMVFPVSAEQRTRFHGRYDAVFYVPRGVDYVAGYAAANSGRMLMDNGEEVYSFARMEGAGYFKIKVPRGRDGKVWKLERVQDGLLLMTVPPFIANHEEQLLIPQDSRR